MSKLSLFSLDPTHWPRLHDEIMPKIAEVREQMQPCTTVHPVLAMLGIEEVMGSTVDVSISGIDFSDAIAFPIRSVSDGTLLNVLFISDAGDGAVEETIIPGATISGGMVSIGEMKGDTIFVTIDLPGALAVAIARDAPVACAIYTENLPEVTAALRTRYPTREIIVCAGTSDGPSLPVATRAAASIGARLAIAETGSTFFGCYKEAGSEGIVRSLEMAEIQDSFGLTVEKSNPLDPPAPTRWPGMVNASLMAQYAVMLVQRYLIIDVYAAITITLWALATYFTREIRVAPLLAFLSPTKQLNHVEYKGRRQQGLDMLTTLYNEDRPKEEHRNFYNGNCLWTAIAYLGSYLHARRYTFDYINLFQTEKAELKKKLAENNYHLVALTGTMYVFEQNIWEVVSFIRRQRRDAKIIAGGPYISKQAEEREPEYLKPLFKYLNADFYAYAREGEETLVRVIDAIKGNGNLDAIPELAYRSGREFIVTGKRRTAPVEVPITIQRASLRTADVQRAPVFAGADHHEHSFVQNMINYPLFAEAYKKYGWANIRVSDGCPYACGFCSFPEHGNEHYVIMRLDRIERELNSIKESGAITHLFFVDATLNVPRGQFKAMLRMMIRNNYGFRWHCFFRCDQTDEETIALMAEAGCEGVFLGLESANETVLRNMDKTAHKEHFRRTMPWFKKHSIRQMISIQVGFPGETYESFQETLDFVEEIEPDYTRIQIWFCDTTTPVWRRRQEFRLEGKGYGWSHYTMDAETAVELVVNSFMSLRKITWVPDPGYNWVAFYSMQKLGMPIDRQKQFLALFAAAAREKLLKPARSTIDANLLREMKRCAKFDVSATPDMSVIEPYSGERYRAAERFWIERFARIESNGLAQLTAEEVRAPEKMRIGATIASATLDSIELPHLATALSAQSHSVVIASIASVPRDVPGVNVHELFLSLDDDAAFPICVEDVGSAEFRDLVGCVDQLIDEAMPHRRFAQFILGNPLRLKQYNRHCPKFNVLVMLIDGPEALEAVVRTRFPSAPSICVEPLWCVLVRREGTELLLEIASSQRGESLAPGKGLLDRILHVIDAHVLE